TGKWRRRISLTSRKKISLWVSPQSDLGHTKRPSPWLSPKSRLEPTRKPGRSVRQRNNQGRKQAAGFNQAACAAVSCTHLFQLVPKLPLGHALSRSSASN